MEAQLIISALPIVGAVLIVLLILLGSKGWNPRKLFALPIFFMVIWLGLQLFAQYASGPKLALIHISLVASLFMALTFFVAIQAHIKKIKPLLLNISLLIFVSIFAILMMAGKSIIAITANPEGITVDSFTPLYMAQLILTLGLFVWASFDLLMYIKKGISHASRKGNLILFASTAQAVTIIGITSLFVDGGAWGQFIIYLSGLIFSIGTSFAILRHGLFDVRRAISRSFVYALSLGVLALTYFGIVTAISIIFFKGQTTVGVSVNPINIGLALILAFIFQPIKQFFDHVTDSIFYRDTYNEGEFIAKMTRQLNTITDLNLLLKYSSSEISKTLKTSFGAFYIYRQDKEPLYVTAGRNHSLPRQDAKSLDTYVKSHGNSIIIEGQLDDENTEARLIQRILVSHRIAIALPIFDNDTLLGYLFLGEQLSSHYRSSDIDILKTLADELAIALQRATSVQQVRELNSTLQQRVDDATKELRASNAQLHRLDKAKDDFISMASHQLRTPLTSIKGYISMVREGDVGKISKTQDQLLGEAFNSSERMVHLINDFLNVSRLQTGKFLIEKHPINLAKVVEQELDSLETNAKSRKLVFTYKAPKKFPLLNVDEDKMRQVIMNFSDNAIYYSKEGSKIQVKLTLDKKDAIFTVTDTGIGVPRAEQSQLFNKFYRASNARKQRPDGTGVGLYLAKTVIDAHGGKVVFESAEGKGSTFGFKLPLGELRVTGDANDLNDQNNKS